MAEVFWLSIHSIPPICAAAQRPLLDKVPLLLLAMVEMVIWFNQEAQAADISTA